MKDRYDTRLFIGAKVVDLRPGKDREGEVMGSPQRDVLLVQWEDERDEEQVREEDVLARGRMSYIRRRR